MRLARLYDGFDQASGPYFSPDHVRIEDPAERERVADFLRDGAVILRSLGLDVDAVEPERGYVVPGSFRTDGDWVWNDGHAYYLLEHGIAPPEDLYSHMVACGYRCAAPDAEALERAVGLLSQRPGGSQAQPRRGPA